MDVSIEVILVDGTGRPKIVPLPDHEPPPFVGYAHEGYNSGPYRAVRFDHMAGVAIDGRAVYRQVNCGEPRIKAEYLKAQPIGPFNPLKLP